MQSFESEHGQAVSFSGSEYINYALNVFMLSYYIFYVLRLLAGKTQTEDAINLGAPMDSGGLPGCGYSLRVGKRNIKVVKRDRIAN